jgi:hypothetical protein
LSPDIPNGTEFKYILCLNNGLFTFRDTITHYYGKPLTIFSDNCNDKSQWTSDKWDITQFQYHSPNASITDSPYGNYLVNTNSSITTTGTFNLNDTPVAVLEFWARWNIEKGYDYAQVKISDDNGLSWTPLAGEYTHPGTTNQVIGQPLYDGKMLPWVKEQIVLNDYLGKQIKLRFTMNSDIWANYDGYYFDDVTITKIDMTTGMNEDQAEDKNFLSEPIPNPAMDIVSFHYSVPGEAVNTFLVIVDSRGVIHEKIQATQKKGSLVIDLNKCSSGIYFCIIENSMGVSQTRKMVVLK